MLAYCEEAIFIDKGILWYRHNGRKIKEDQLTVGASFTDIQCRKEEECEVPAHHTWMDRLFNSPYIYLVRGKDKGRQAWHYVLVDKGILWYRHNGRKIKEDQLTVGASFTDSMW